jgi:hypothetical protein
VAEGLLVPGKAIRAWRCAIALQYQQSARSG